jgi:hypothetical protein
MEISRIEFIEKLDDIIGLVKTLRITTEEETEKLKFKDIKEMTAIIENMLINMINWLKAEHNIIN